MPVPFTQRAEELYRDREEVLNPSSAPWTPPKPGLRKWGGEIEDALDAATDGLADAVGDIVTVISEIEDVGDRVTILEAQDISSTIIKATWTELNALTGSFAGQKAEVPSTDAGTHTDPVVGGTKANAGVYTWSVSPAGWKWIVADGLSTKANIDSPVFVNEPKGPTAPDGTSNAQLATTEFVQRNKPPVFTDLIIDDDIADGPLIFRDPDTGEDLVVIGGGGGGNDDLPSAALLASVNDATSGYSVAAESNRLEHWLQMGQSLSRGSNSDGGPVAGGGWLYNTTPLYPDYVLMLSAGLMPEGAPSTGLVSAVEGYKGSNGETGLLAFLNRLHKLRYDATGVRQLLSGSVAGTNGTAYEGLRRGCAAFERALVDVGQARDYALARGMGFYVRGVRWLHGNNNTDITSRAQYKRFMFQLWEDLNAAIQRITGQIEPVILYLDQVDSGAWIASGSVSGVETGVPLGQLDAVLSDHPFIREIGGHYDIPRDAANTVHPSSVGYMWMGERDAEIVADDLNGAGRVPFAPTDWWWANAAKSIIDIKINCPRGPLVLDMSGTYVTATGLDFGLGANGCGFEFADGVSPGPPPYVSGVSIVEAQSTEAPSSILRVTLSAVSTGPRPRLLYAMRESVNNNEGPITGCRGLIRNSSAAVSTAFPNAGSRPPAAARPLYEWMKRCVLPLY